MSYAAAHSAIRLKFETAWGATTSVQYPMVQDFQIPDASPWVRLNIEDANSFWASMGSPGSNVERNVGLVTMQIFVLSGEGEGQALELADQAKAVFRSWQDTASGVRFVVPPYARQVGVDGKWYQINVLAPFRFDDLA